MGCNLNYRSLSAKRAWLKGKAFRRKPGFISRRTAQRRSAKESRDKTIAMIVMLFACMISIFASRGC
jgi:hypothetical protein